MNRNIFNKIKTFNVMKSTNFTTSVLSICIVLFSLSVSAQKTATQALETQIVSDLSKTPKMALGLQKEHHIAGAFNFFDQLLASNMDLEHFEIVIWGSVVEEFSKPSQLSRIIEKNQHPKLRVSVCQQAMKRFNVTDEDLPEGATSVENAFTRLLQIQANGYNVIVP